MNKITLYAVSMAVGFLLAGSGQQAYSQDKSAIGTSTDVQRSTTTTTTSTTDQIPSAWWCGSSEPTNSASFAIFGSVEENDGSVATLIIRRPSYLSDILGTDFDRAASTGVISYNDASGNTVQSVIVSFRPQGYDLGCAGSAFLRQRLADYSTNSPLGPVRSQAGTFSSADSPCNIQFVVNLDDIPDGMTNIVGEMCVDIGDQHFLGRFVLTINSSGIVNPVANLSFTAGELLSPGTWSSGYAPLFE